MKRVIVYSLVILTTFYLRSQNIREKVLETDITQVTVFIKGAQIYREGSTSIPKGESLIKVTELSPYVNPNSISAKALGDFVILSVKHKLNYLNELKKSDRIDSLSQIIERLDLSIAKIKNDQEVLDEKLSLLNSNKSLGGENGVSIDELRQAVQFYESVIADIKTKSLQNELDMKKLVERKRNLQMEINQLNVDKSQPTSEIHIRVKAENTVNGKFEINYPVSNAGWFPRYDIRVKDIDTPLSLEYKADVYQNTGIDWDQVSLRLSTADPNQSGVLPNLETWYLNYERNTIRRDYSDASVLFYNENTYRTVKGRITDDTGEGLPGVNVVIKGTTSGTTTDLDGNYQLTVSGSDILVYSFVGFETQEVAVGGRSTLDIAMGGATELQEVVVTGYAGSSYSGYRHYNKRVKEEKITTSKIQNTTSFSFQVDIPYSIPSTGEKLSVDLKQYQIDAAYKYYAIPKLDTDAFLIARLTDWAGYNLLEGQANLFFEGTFVGQTILNPKAFSDTLDISLGRDKGIIIERESVAEYTKRRVIGGTQIETQAFLLKVRNQKDQPVDLTIYDQIPVAAINQISVIVDELTSGSLDPDTGKIEWVLNLMPREQAERTLQYRVKYPKNEEILLE